METFYGKSRKKIVAKFNDIWKEHWGVFNESLIRYDGVSLYYLKYLDIVAPMINFVSK